MKAELKKRHLDQLFIKSLLTGELKELLAMIKQDNTLCLCFRGQYISVYYKGESLFKIEQLKQSYKINFDFNHARYTQKADEQLKRLIELGYKKKEGKEKKGDRSRKILCKYPSPNINTTSYDFWIESSKIMKSLIEDFLDFKKKQDYFKTKGKKGNRNKNCHLERQRQQDIMRINNSLDEEYFVYDIEYAQPRNSRDDDNSGRFDMLALRRVSKGSYNLVFVELKSTITACSGKCDIEKHRRDLKKYIENNDIVDIRKIDAVEICRQYGLLGLVEQESVKVEDVEILFVFTDEAIKYADKIENIRERCILLPEKFKLRYNERVL